MSTMWVCTLFFMTSHFSEWIWYWHIRTNYDDGRVLIQNYSIRYYSKLCTYKFNLLMHILYYRVMEYESSFFTKAYITNTNGYWEIYVV